jgi:hypothetical protein
VANIQIWYNSLQVVVNKKMSRGLALTESTKVAQRKGLKLEV